MRRLVLKQISPFVLLALVAACSEQEPIASNVESVI